MNPVSTIKGRAYPLNINNIDTDLIIPAVYMKTVTRDGLGKAAFETLRAKPGNVFEDPQFSGAPILIAGANFGCGSSREHAVWALYDLGLRAIISTGFSDIFESNAFKNGILTVTLPPSAVERLFELAWSQPITIDLPGQTVVADVGERFSFDMDSFRKQCLLTGIDEVDATLAFKPDIEAYERLAAVKYAWREPRSGRPE